MKRSLLLLVFAVLLTAAPLLFIPHSDFGGTDGQAEKTIQVIAPHYQPWAQTIFEPPGGEVETLLFSVQAAVGAGIIGYIIGVYKGRANKREEAK
ncbi:energy-coupling factor ABC transporter substrate-binding protein [Parageobacillus thermoglucosidasius]|jgi:cobalt/nickel transport protein|uniref:energy-coupling factor ABC transporter substrate-binding protein n=1 Tax=Parageobacillus thermoglucosidasius TaxID=1426 RepID=UPI000E16F3AE|nr:energy-coupling factor ABC transporter substrate-binding protein [Parageobacillus thermoglucosidasius]MED4904754.1 energy-coupling factor ABC transporter substrate-binding protein [Parageobacillus thermoglucosidasius]MED4913683.1 energy-coupling factor ABC transporter substrate-binding protein [Parageobacillus thermoglucosidasius]MED4944921.1 energy-coupling factor ABC transporter substrate-binding protein [Parageobacillus thermoglucosidasius]MED4983470.1 energy-coupling factor ABC transport